MPTNFNTAANLGLGEKRRREKSPQCNMTNVSNPLMMVYVAAVMKPKHQSVIRSAGTVGADVYEEVVAQGLVGTHLELAKSIYGSGDTKQHVPVTIEGCNRKPTFDDNDVLILHSAQVGSEVVANSFGVNRIIRTRINHIKNIRLCGFEKVKRTLFEFLASSTSLAAIDTSALRNVKRIGYGFLTSCTFLTVINLSPLVNVTHIGPNFLAFCTSLVTIDLSPFANVRRIGPGFLAYCTSLAAIDLSPFVSVTFVGSNFLASCTSLAAIDMRPLANVTHIGSKCLSSCTSLVAIDLSPLVNVTRIGYFFMAKCTLLTNVSLPPASGINTASIFHGCDSLHRWASGDIIKEWIEKGNEEHSLGSEADDGTSTESLFPYSSAESPSLEENESEDDDWA